jgi:hypothetical protein
MYFTFAEESSYGIDTTSQDYVLDLVSESIIDNVNFKKTQEFNHPTAQGRYKSLETTEGRLAFEFTYNNEAWNKVFEVLLGQRIRLTSFELAHSSENWRVLTGMLSANIDEDDISFTITENKVGDFDTVDGIIINGEYIAISSISNGVVSSSTRGSEGTTASLHLKNALVYGVVVSGDKYIDIISRYSNGFSYFLTKSISSQIYRDGDYFTFPGMQFNDFVFNARPKEGISSSFESVCKFSRVITLENPSLEEDNGQMVDTDEIICFSDGDYFDVSTFYFQVSNTLSLSPSKFMDYTNQGLILNHFSTYGQFSPVDSDADYLRQYKENVERNLSLTICKNKEMNNIYIFSFNKTMIGTMIHALNSSILIDDSLPFYCFGENEFNILIQNEV